MTLRNRLHNWLHGIKRYRAKGCHNVGLRWVKGERWVVKYDWSQPFVYRTKTFPVDYGSFERHLTPYEKYVRTHQDLVKPLDSFATGSNELLKAKAS